MPTNALPKRKIAVSALREVVVEGVLEIPLEELLGVCAFLGIWVDFYM